jgi:hypothetical protein
LSDIIDANLFNTDKKHDVLTWYDIFTKQNYFSSKEEIIFQNEGLEMDAPSCAIQFVLHTVFRVSTCVRNSHVQTKYLEKEDKEGDY